MIHKLLMVAVLALILFIVWSSMHGYIIIWMLFLLGVLAALYYVTTSVISKGMVKKAYGDVFSFKAGIIENGGKDLGNGRFIATPTELMFVKRKADMGGCRVCWSAPTAALESYTLGKVDEYHMGISLVIKGEKKDPFFPSKEIAGLEKEFRKAIGWGDEEKSPAEN